MMTDYAKVVDGEVVEVGPEPNSWVNPDGSTTITPEDTPTPASVLRKAGYLPVEYADHNAGLLEGWNYKITGPKVLASPIHADEKLKPKTDKEVVEEWMNNQQTLVNEMADKFVERTQRMDDHNNWLWERIGDITKIQNDIQLLNDRLDDLFVKLDSFETKSLSTTLTDIVTRVRALEER